MKEAEQALLDQIKDQVIKEVTQGEYLTFQSADDDGVMITEEVVNLVANRFATAKAQASCEATLKTAAENARIKADVDPIYEGGDILYFIDKSSITDPSNITIV